MSPLVERENQVALVLPSTVIRSKPESGPWTFRWGLRRARWQNLMIGKAWVVFVLPPYGGARQE